MEATTRQLLSAITPDLREHGFRRKGGTFQITSDGDVGFVNVQSRLTRTHHKLVVTANAAVSLGSLRRWFPTQVGQEPHYSEGHWRLRIGYLMPERTDVWWEIESVDPQCREMLAFRHAVRTYAIPEVKRHLSPAEIRDIYLAGPYPFIDDIRRLSLLVAFVAEFGPHARFDSVAQQLRECSRDAGADWESRSINLIQRARRLIATQSHHRGTPK